MINIDEFAKKIQEKQGTDPSDYEKDGIMYCGKCNTPRQAMIDCNGIIKKLPIMCKCRSDDYDSKKDKDKKMQRYYASMEKLEKYDLAIKSEHCDDRVMRYLEKWEEMQDKNIGLLLWGDVGTGKSTSAAFVCNELKAKYVPCIITNFSKLVQFNEKLPRLNSADLLVLDDLGAERQSEFMLEKVFEIVDDRINSKKPVIFTTNLSVEEIKNPKDMKYRRLYDRILSCTVPLLFKGKSYREGQSKEKLEEAKKLLE